MKNNLRDSELLVLEDILKVILIFPSLKKSRSLDSYSMDPPETKCSGSQIIPHV